MTVRVHELPGAAAALTVSVAVRRTGETVATMLVDPARGIGAVAAAGGVNGGVWDGAEGLFVVEHAVARNMAVTHVAAAIHRVTCSSPAPEHREIPADEYTRRSEAGPRTHVPWTG